MLRGGTPDVLVHQDRNTEFDGKRNSLILTCPDSQMQVVLRCLNLDPSRQAARPLRYWGRRTGMT